MQISNVNYQELNLEFRIDAEYYSPFNLSIESKVTNKPYKFIDDICKLVAGPFGSAVTTESYDEHSNRRYIRGKDIQSFFVEKNDPVFIKKSLFNELSQFHLKERDLLVTVVGMNFGKVAIVYPEDCPCIFSCKSTLIRDVQINPFYLAAYLSCDIGYALIRRGQRGAAQPGINLFDIKNIPVPIFADSFQKFIETLIQTAYLQTQLSISAYKKGLVVFLNELNLENWQPKRRIPYVRQYAEVEKAGRFDAEHYQPKYDEILAAVKNVKHLPLGEIVKYSKGVEVGSDAYEDEGVPFIRVSDVSEKGIDRFEKHISEKLYNSLDAKFTPRKGDILMTKDGTIGISFVVDENTKAVLSGAFLKLKPKISIEKEYLALVLNSVVCKQQIEKLAGGALIAHLKPSDAMNLLIPLLDDDKQKEIVNQVLKAKEARRKSKTMLDIAKRGVEIAIEENENAAQDWMLSQLAATGFNPDELKTPNS